MPDHKRVKWDYVLGEKLFGFPLVEARWFGLRTGYFFLCSNRNGVLFNPSVIEGDKARRIVITKDDLGNPTQCHYVPVIVTSTHDDGTVDITWMDSGRVEHGMHPRQRTKMMVRMVDDEPQYRMVKAVRGLEVGRLLRFLRWVGDSCCAATFECKRRIPYFGTISRRRYLVSMYGARSLQKREVADAFRTFHVKRKEQMKWLELWGSIDVNGDNGMDIGEFCGFFELPFSPLSQRAFELFNESHSGKISFVEFLYGIWDFCPLGDEKSKVFWYRILTKSGRGMTDDVVVDLRDIKHVMKQFYGRKGAEVRAEMVDITADDDASGGITYREWLDFSRAHLLLMYPGYWMQEKLRAKVFGRRFWTAKTDHRRHDGAFRRNKVLEKALAAFDRMPIDHGTGKRIFEADFAWEGKRPATDWGKRGRVKVLPLTETLAQERQENSRLPASTVRIVDHIQNWSFNG